MFDRCGMKTKSDGRVIPTNRLFIVGNNSECFEHEGVAAALDHDGAMFTASDDPDELSNGLKTRLVIDSPPPRPAPRPARVSQH